MKKKYTVLYLFILFIGIINGSSNSKINRPFNAIHFNEFSSDNSIDDLDLSESGVNGNQPFLFMNTADTCTLSATASLVENFSCSGGINGSAIVYPVGGTPPYTYLWSGNYGTNPMATGLSAGNYTITVTDSNGCTVSVTEMINKHLTLSISALTITNVSCNGNNDGSVVATANGGLQPYTYLWSDGTTQIIDDQLFAGTYTLYVTDSAGCSDSALAIITQPVALNIYSYSSINISCNGGSNGSVNSFVSGGTSPYTYSWSSNGGSNSKIRGVTSGTYVLSVWDSCGGSASSSISLTQPNPLYASSNILNNATCVYESDGVAAVNVTGGTLPYTYSWDDLNDQTTDTAYYLGAGTYTVTITDSNECTASVEVVITQPDFLSLSSGVNNISCFGGTGSSWVIPSGGTSPYVYQWSDSNNQTTDTATGLSFGTYSISVTDICGATSYTSITITQPASALMIIAASANNIDCEGEFGSASSSVSGGTSPYTYSWSNSQTSVNSTGLSAGTYTLLVTDHNGCSGNSVVTISQPSALLVSTSVTANVSCNGGTTGSASSSASGGTSPYTYSWSNSQTSLNSTGLSAGTYTLLVTDHNRCSGNSLVTISQPSALLVSTSATANVSCNGGTTGSASSSASGGTSPYTYSWSNSQTSLNSTGLLAGTYTLLVTDHNGCSGNSVVTISQPSALLVSTSATANVSCNGGTTGSASSSASGGTSPYIYSWSNSQTSLNSTGLSAGTYTLLVTDHNGCSGNSVVTISQPSALLVSTSVTANVSCNGGTTGSASSSASGGTSPYTYSWSNSQTSLNSTGLLAGTYTLLVTDHNGCSGNSVVTISQPSALLVSTSATANVSCNGGTTGSASSSASGGTSPYIYSWSNSQTSLNSTGLSAGTYTLLVTDHNGCSGNSLVTISQPSALLVSTSVTANVSCNGGTTGSASSSASGGTSPYTYSWSNSQTSLNSTGLSAGTYTLLVTDHNGCSGNSLVTISQPSALLVSTSVTANVSCNGGTTGSASSSASGGTSPYTYSWSNSQTSLNSTGLSAGTYTLLVTDHNGCSGNSLVTISQPSALLVSTSVTANVSCNGGTTGSASSSASGGTSPYTYSWSNSQTSLNSTGLSAGTYTLLVTDHNGCSGNSLVTISQPSALLVSTSVTANVSCNGGTTGSASSSASGGTSPYTYSWAPGSNSTSTDSGLSAGTYTIHVTSNSGCTASAAATITQPTGMTISATVTNESCNGGITGKVIATVSGGTSPYTYSWAPGSNSTSTDSGLSAGTYTIHVTSNSGCTASAAATITQPTGMTISATVTNESCNGGITGKVIATVSGGTSPYTYSWAPGSNSTSTDSGLSAGTYTIHITSNSGCTASAAATITQPTGMTISATVTNESCNGGITGKVIATVSGGTSPYTYSWAPGSNSTSTDSGLSAGTYTIHVTSNSGCTASAAATITQPTGMTISATVTNESCNGGITGKVIATVSGGTSPYTYSWAPGSNSTSTDSGLSAGTYTIHVTSNSGCTASAAATITQPTGMTISATVTNESCNGGITGKVIATVSGGTSPYTYSWAPGSNSTSTDSGLSAGTYTIHVTSNSGCTASAAATITQPTGMTISATVTNESCNGGITGKVIATVSGGTSPYTYSWAPGSNSTSTDSGLSAGTYTIHVTSNSGCTASAAATITQPTGMTISATVTNESCNGGITGKVIATVSGGTSPYTYSWAPGSNSTSTDSGLSAGTYTIHVTSNSGCTASAAATITQPTGMTISATVTNESCNGGITGKVIATVSGGTSPYTYSWAPGSNSTSTDSGLSAGTYTIHITSNSGCTASAAATITQPTGMTISATVTNESCNGGITGKVIATVSGGTSPYTYSWAPGSNSTSTDSGLSAGTYTIHVTSNSGCTASAAATITQPLALSVSASTTANISCNSGNNGSASSSANGGTSPYTYSWSNSQLTPNATGLSAGAYTVTITDHNGCTGSAVAIITQSSALSVSASTTANISCNSGNNGSASSSANGGTSPYTYSWSNTQLTSNVTGLSAGTYTISITDHNGCTGSAVAIITQSSALSVSASTTANISCNSGNNGSASSSANGGTSPYTYSWSNSQLTSNVTGLSAGTYTISITDHNGCTGSAVAIITQSSALSVSASTTANISCNSGNNGSASSSANGGTSPYTYSWSNSQLTPNATGLSAGTYTITITDHNGCTGSTAATVTQPLALSVSASTTANISCNSGNNGSASSSANGGTSPYTYSWSNSQLTPNATGLSAGAYTVTITDHNGCTGSAVATITQSSALSVSASTTANISCNSGNNGSASSSANGGTSPYTYSWSNSQLTPNATGLSAGTYTITITDHNGCTGSASVTITQPAVMTVTASVTANESCNGGISGSATSTPSGGTSPYTYSWAPGGGSLSSATGLSAGTYTITITDHNGCTGSAVATITQSSALSVSASTTANISCNNGNNGSASSSANGGTSPYTYSWSNSHLTPNATGLSAGTYTITITDHNGCIGSASVTITQPAVMTVTASVTANESCNGGISGSATSTPSGGTSPYTYSWAPGGGSLSSATGLSAGTYSIHVTSNTGCTATSTVTITQPAVMTVIASVTANESCNGGISGSATSTPSGGTSPYTYSWAPGGGSLSLATGLSAGTYTITITDHNGCIGSAVATVTQPLALSVSASTTANISCNNGNNGSASSSANGGTSPYTYSWSNSQLTPNAIGLSAGTYTITITDHNGCTGSAVATITQSSALSVSASTTANISCNSGNNGSASSSANGGTSPYTYSWSNSQLTPNATGLSAGTYTITITDHNGCTGSTAATVTQPLALSVSASTTANISCNSGNNGSASSSANGGTSPYTYSWSNSQLTPNATGLSAGAYTVTITDHNGCTGSAVATITQSSALSVSASTTANISCNSGNNGSASSSANGGTSPYTYSWSNSQLTPNATGLSAGTYTITITDHNGCTGSASVTITQPAVMTVTASVTANESCNGGISGSATSTPSGGTSPYTYSWAPGGGSLSSATGLSAGTYTITITDHNGCTGSAVATITQSSALSVSASTTANISCNNGNNGSASSSANGGTSPYTYSWSNSHLTPNATGLSAGTYTITITDHNGCIGSASVTITQPAVMMVTASVTANESCNGGISGSASSTPSGGTSPYTYSWSNSQLTSNATGLSAGTYTITITDHNGCTGSTAATVTQPLALSVSASTTANISCNSGNNGSASSSANGGTSPYTYSWSNSQLTPNATGLSAGAYTVTITDHNGCIGSGSVTITQPAVMTVTASVTANESCNGGISGSASSTPSGGTSPYTYSWSNSQLTPNATGLSAGTYTITITDHNGCTGSTAATVTQPLALSVSASTTANISCNSGNNGSASSSANGGTSPYTYSWAPGGGSLSSATGLSAGTYTIHVTSNTGCTATSTITITQPAVMTVIASVTANESCSGGISGSATSTPSGGTSPYTYSWSNSQLTSNATGLSAGTYTISITDHNGCIGSGSVTITQPAIMTVTASVTANESCNGGISGSASSTPSGGTSPYTYLWAPGGGSLSSATGLSAGIYTIHVTSNTGCTATSAVTITQPAVMTVIASVTANESCNGGISGSASSTPSGGTSPYTYSWAPGGGSLSSATGLSAGTYTIHVTSNTGCTATSTVTITQPAVMTVIASVTANESCNGGISGSATSTPSGGTSPYTYSWAPSGGSLSSITGLSAGTYTVHLTSNSGCASSVSVTITQPAAINISTSITPVSCNGGANGKVTITPSGGTSPYTYSWSNGGTTSSKTGISAGIFTITVIDKNNCSSSVNISITQPGILGLSISSWTTILCNGGKGTATANSATGGTSPYTYSWSSGGGTNLSASNLSGGSYTITATDNHACVAVATVIITQPTAIRDSIISYLSCTGGTDSLHAGIKGGTSPYTFSWSTGATKSNITGLSAGSYTLTLTDHNGCVVTTAIALVSITPPPTPIIAAINPDSTAFTVSNAASGASYVWTLTDITGNYAGTGDTAYLPVWPRKATLTFYADSGLSCQTSASVKIAHNIALPSQKPYPRWSKRGMYLEWGCYYIDSTYKVKDNAITPVVNYCRNNHITYVLIDGVQANGQSCGVFGVDSAGVDAKNAANLMSFIDSLKTRGRVQEVGIECYSSQSVKTPDSNSYSVLNYNLDNYLENVNAMNNGLPWNEKIDVLSLDQEFWLNFKGTSSSSKDYMYSVEDFHKQHMPMLKSMYKAAHECSANNLRVEDYIATPLDPWGIVSDTALYQLKVGAMELDSIGLYTDRLLLASYTGYHIVLWNEGDFIQVDSEVGRNPFHAYYKKEIWPVFSAENADSGTCTKYAYFPGDDFSGSNLCTEKKTANAEWIEQEYFDSLSTSENHSPSRVFTNNLNGAFYETPMGADTDFQISGDMWFDYKSLEEQNFSFDTNTGGTNKGYLRFYVTLGHDTQYVPPKTPPITITATVHGGKGPYSYTWYNVDNGRVLLYSTTGKTYTVGYNPLTNSYPVSRLGVVVKDAGDTNATDYVCIYSVCKNGNGIRKPVITSESNQIISPLLENSVKVYPNPNKGEFTVDIRSSDATAKTIEIYTIMGQRIYDEPLNNLQGASTIYMNNPSNGVYFYRVLSESGNFIGEGKLIIER